MFSYLREFSRDLNVASITPTRQEVAQSILSRLDLSEAKVIVEFGPGGGVFTKQILNRIGHDARVIALETNRKFVEQRRTEIFDPRLTILETSAEFIGEELRKLGLVQAELVLSGIPFSLLNINQATAILSQVAALLSPKGSFLVYQSLAVPRGMSTMLELLERYFECSESDHFWANLPPLYSVECHPMMSRQLLAHQRGSRGDSPQQKSAGISNFS